MCNSGENRGELELMRRDAEAIFQAALAAVDPEEAVLRHLSLEGQELRVGDLIVELDRFQNIWVLGAGKADAPMARALEKILGDRISGGLIVVKEGHGLDLERIEVWEASHPLPDQRGVQGTLKVLHMAEKAGSRDLILALFSGGGSALLVAPAQGISLQDKQETTRLLLSCGATIHEINVVRKHLSSVKGGQLARVSYPATVVSLILSDVIGDNLDAIASGPTVPDTSTFAQAREVLLKYGIWEDVPPSVRERLQEGCQGRIQETPKAGEICFERTHWKILGSNLQALKGAMAHAEKIGYRALILSSCLEGEAREVARAVSAVAKEVLRSGNPLRAPACLLCGGETTVTLRGQGKGGRNQEFALAAALALDGWEHVVALSGGTDGTDGPTDAAGAVVDGTTVQRARRAGLSPELYLEKNDSYNFFGSLGQLLITGPTRTNVMDVNIFLMRESKQRNAGVLKN
ncbi:MAG: glycerate kinase [bacterium]